MTIKPEETVQQSIKSLRAWLDLNGLEGYDPYDALLNPCLAALGGYSNLAGRVAIVALLNFPIDIRPLFRIIKKAAMPFWGGTAVVILSGK